MTIKYETTSNHCISPNKSCLPLNLYSAQISAFHNISSLGRNFEEMTIDLVAKQKDLTSTQFRYALEAILALGILNYNGKFIANIVNESTRNTEITKLTGLIAEPGLVLGQTSEEISGSLKARVDLLITTYLADKESDDTVSLWRSGFIGPPCFNGRMITLQEYRCEKQLLIDRSKIENLVTVSDQTDFDPIAIELVELMYEFNDNQLPEKVSFKKFLIDKGELKYLTEYNKLYQRATELYV